MKLPSSFSRLTCLSSCPRNLDDRIFLGLEYIELAPGFVREVVDVYDTWDGKRGRSDEAPGTDDGTTDRSLQTLQARRSSPRIRKTKDQDTSRHQTGLEECPPKSSYLISWKKWDTHISRHIDGPKM